MTYGAPLRFTRGQQIIAVVLTVVLVGLFLWMEG